MSIGDYLFYSVVGICVVFCVLLLLMLVIKAVMYTPAAKAAPQDAPAPAPEAAASPAPPIALAPGSAGDVKLYDTDPRDAALIMAIVADELKKPLNELRFISIREVRK